MSEHKVQLRGGFSDRNKIDPINTTLQTEAFDDRTRIAVLNLLRSWINDLSEVDRASLYTSLFADVFNEFVDDRMVLRARVREEETFYEYIYTTIMSSNYGDVLTITEYICQWFHGQLGDYHLGCDSLYIRALNALFEREFVGYRMIDGKIVAITDPVEIKEIEESLDIKFQGTKTHIQKALGFLADREHKDYKNSIKESISAVESVCKIIVEKENATLGDALKILESKRGLKGQLKAGFEKLYNYTNDKGGIRHAEGLFESNVTFEEAKYMLVSCCAFVNYLIAEYGKTK